MNTRSALVREVGFDTLDALGAATKAGQLRSTGLTFALIYVEVATKGIVQALLQAQIDVGFLSEARISGWSEATGEEDGKRAAGKMLALGAPPVVSLGCDMEAGVPDEATAIAYANGWYEGALSEGVLANAPDLYVGARSGFASSRGLYSVGFRRYHKSFSDVPTPAPRGYCAIQLWPGDQTLFGVRIDYDVTLQDWEGGSLTLLTL